MIWKEVMKGLLYKNHVMHRSGHLGFKDGSKEMTYKCMEWITHIRSRFMSMVYARNDVF